jgi:trans-aconitate methyltransferase
VLEHLGSRPSRAVLDVGCGNGWILQALATSPFPGLELYGIEPSPIGVAHSRRRVPSAHVTESTLQAQHFGRRFDAVICSEVIEHVEAQYSFVSLLASQLTDGGVLVLTTPNARYRATYFDRLGLEPQPVEAWLTTRELTRLLREKFSTVSVTSFDLVFWSHLHPRAAEFVRGMQAVRGGWRTSRLWERYMLSVARRGLYLLAKATGPRH